MTDREVIRALLERWDDLAGLSSRGTGGGSEERAAIRGHARGCGVFSSLRCSCWLRSVDELDRCLRTLRASRPDVYRHVEARYGQTVKARRRHVRFRAGHWLGLQANEAVLIPRFDERSKGRVGERERVYDEILLVRWPHWVRAGTAEEGLEMIEREFHGTPALPAEAA